MACICMATVVPRCLGMGGEVYSRIVVWSVVKAHSKCLMCVCTKCGCRWIDSVAAMGNGNDGS
jgi:hypothetical protein